MLFGYIYIIDEIIDFWMFLSALGEAVLNVLGCLVPFLEHDLLDALPYTVAALLAVFPAALHRDAIDLLCTNLLPMTLGLYFIYIILYVLPSEC